MLAQIRGRPASIKAPDDSSSATLSEKMPNTWSHLFAAAALAILALAVHVMMRSDGNTRALDTAKYYTLRRVPGDRTAAQAIVDDNAQWPSLACQAAVNTTTTSDACVVSRRALRNGILSQMKCFDYNSQVCMYLRNVTSGIIQNRTYGGTTYFLGRSLLGTIPNMGTLTYRQLIRDAIGKAPLLLHNSFKAAQDNEFYVLRTVLYNLVAWTILANLAVHVLDENAWVWRTRLIMRLAVFLGLTTVPAFVLIIGAWGSALTVFVYIFLPAVIVLVYYEAYLDASITRPWYACCSLLVLCAPDTTPPRRIHPFAFAIIYAVLSTLSLTENSVLNAQTVTLAILQAHSVSLLYMQVVWYWAGYTEKKTHDPSKTHVGGHAAELYLTKEMQYALFLAIVLLAVLPVLQALAPYDYDLADVTLRLAPALFLALSVWGTLYLQSMNLDDEYGRDKLAAEPEPSEGPRQALVWRATRITGGKLAVSLLLIIFGVLYEFNILGLYFRTLRAYNDKLPERAWQLDTASRFTIGAGFLPAPTLYL